MNNIKIFITKHKLFFVLVLISAVSILYIFSSISDKNQAPTTKTSPQKIIFDNLIPGIATQDDANKILGKPLRTSKEQALTINEYKSNSDIRSHVAYFSDNTLTFFKENITSNDNKDSTIITSVYGIAPNIFYSNDPTDPFKLYVYADKGIAYIGHPDGTLLEIWYFQPTDIESFINNFGEGYSKEKPQNTSLY